MRLKARFFQSTLHELNERNRSADTYEALHIAPLVRKLLMEGTPLLDVMNRKHPIPIVFRVRVHAARAAPGEPAAVWLANAELDPMTPAPPPRVPRPTLELRRDGFLAHEVGRVDGQQIRICDVIELTSSALNGSESNAPDIRGTVLNDVASVYQSFVGSSGPQDSAVDQLADLLRGIGRVAARAAEPLSQRISTDGDASMWRAG